MEDTVVISDKIKSLREKKKIRQKEFAKIIGTSATYLSSIETGKRQPTLKMLYTISKTYGVPLEYFFEDIDLENQQVTLNLSEKNNQSQTISIDYHETLISEYREREKFFLQKEEKYLEMISNLSKP